VLDPTGDRDGGGGVDGQGGAEVAAGDRGGLGELILPLQPLRAMHPLPSTPRRSACRSSFLALISQSGRP
jgi:hypothetical protein